MKLLIADDEQAVRALVHVTLEGDDYEILEAADGVEALEVARGEVPRLVLLDIMMPRLDGLEVCRQLKSDPLTRDIVVVMLTAQAQERDRDQGLAAGADDYFTKPFSPLALLNMVERVRQEQLARYFSDAGRPMGMAQFEPVAWQPGPVTGAPLLGGALAWLEVEVQQVHDGGDHLVYLARVLAAERRALGDPLLYFGGDYRRLGG